MYPTQGEGLRKQAPLAGSTPITYFGVKCSLCAFTQGVLLGHTSSCMRSVVLVQRSEFCLVLVFN